MTSSCSRELNGRRASRSRLRFLGCLLVLTTVLIISFYNGFYRLVLLDTARNLANEENPLRILYIVTSLAEFNNGRRWTRKHSDRLGDTLVPVVVEGVESMLSFGYQVDVYLVCHYKMKPERLEMVRQRLPASVGLEIWDDATPLGYKMETNHNHTEDITRALARQHRFVIRDKLLDYDFFVVFEDDMLVKGDHVKTFLEITNQLARLRSDAPIDIRNPNGIKPLHMFYGPLTKTQLSRLIPGFMRVEALLNETQYGAQKELAPVPVDLEFNGRNVTVDPGPCCHVSNKTVGYHIPLAPTADQLFIWETAIQGLGVREIPSVGWVTTLSGTPNIGKRYYVVGDYWSGRNNTFGPGVVREIPGHAPYLNNQGGWMATRQQILEWHIEQCQGGLLPPFDLPYFQADGLDLRNVEYWSGGMQLFGGQNGCNLQRIVSLDPENFSRQLLYHTANNKQRQLTARKKSDRFVKVNNLLGQLNTVRKRAHETKRVETGNATSPIQAKYAN